MSNLQTRLRAAERRFEKAEAEAESYDGAQDWYAVSVRLRAETEELPLYFCQTGTLRMVSMYAIDEWFRKVDAGGDASPNGFLNHLLKHFGETGDYQVVAEAGQHPTVEAELEVDPVLRKVRLYTKSGGWDVPVREWSFDDYRYISGDVRGCSGEDEFLAAMVRGDRFIDLVTPGYSVVAAERRNAEADLCAVRREINAASKPTLSLVTA